jgi:hypothetical protein
LWRAESWLGWSVLTKVALLRWLGSFSHDLTKGKRDDSSYPAQPDAKIEVADTLLRGVAFGFERVYRVGMMDLLREWDGSFAQGVSHPDPTTRTRFTPASISDQRQGPPSLLSWHIPFRPSGQQR